MWNGVDCISSTLQIIRKKEATVRGVDIEGRSQRQMLRVLRAQDDRKPVQPHLVDFTYASASESAAESQTDCEKSDDESDEPPPVPSKEGE